MSTPPAFDSTVLVAVGDTVQLRGGACGSCGRLHFPFSAACPRCGGPTAEEMLPGTGTLHAQTSTALPVHGAPSPATIALVELGPDVIVQGVVGGPVSIGDTVRLVARTVPGPEGELLAYGFEREARRA